MTVVLVFRYRANHLQYATDVTASGSLSINMIVLYLDIRNVGTVLYIHGSVHRESN